MPGMVAPFRIVTVRRCMLRTFMLRKEFVLLAIVISTSLCFLPSASAQAPPPTSEKQEVLWMKLEKSILDIDRGLDGVMGVAVIDLVDGHKYLRASAAPPASLGGQAVSFGHGVPRGTTAGDDVRACRLICRGETCDVSPPGGGT